MVVEREAPGGQAGQSAAIENYLGFPKGLTGADLTHRAVAQVVAVRRRDGARPRRRRLRDARAGARGAASTASGEIEARAVVVATGVSYRRLEAPGLDELTGRGVYYGANASEASQCEGDDVYVVGAANSAGQAALNLARYAKRVVLVVAGRDARATPCRSYLVDADRRRAQHRGAATAARSSAARGDGHLEALTPRRPGHRRDARRSPPSWLFVFIGASPRTDWLGADVVRDDKGFVVTGQDLLAPGRRRRVAAGRGRRSRWRPACPGCSRPATSGSTR